MNTQATSMSLGAGAVQAVTLPVSKIVPWALLTAVVATLVYYFIGSEQGATTLIAGGDIHEFVHDARHLLGFPCH